MAWLDSAPKLNDQYDPIPMCVLLILLWLCRLGLVLPAGGVDVSELGIRSSKTRFLSWSMILNNIRVCLGHPVDVKNVWFTKRVQLIKKKSTSVASSV